MAPFVSKSKQHISKQSICIESLLLLLFFFCALYASWLVLVECNFFYGVWHQFMIDDHIARYAPQNQFGKTDFATTTLTQREALFALLVDAIHQAPEQAKSTLTHINYTTTQGSQPLLTQAEVMHLVDVTRLVRFFTYFSWTIYFVAIGLCFFLLHKKQPTQITLRTSMYLVAMLVLLVGGIVAVGAKDIFYQLHLFVFPANNRWFFYYQESLMSTMMQAPWLFLYTGVVWLCITCFLSALFVWLWDFGVVPITQKHHKWWAR